MEHDLSTFDIVWPAISVLLFVAFLLFLHSGHFAGLLDRLLTVATADIPKPKNRRERKKRPKPPSAAQKKAFWILIGFLGTLTALDLFVLPAAYQLPDDWIMPSIATAFEAGALIIFIGPVVWFGRTNWSKWTYWLSVITTVSLLLWSSHALHFRRPKSLLLVLFLSFLQFLWLFGVLGRIDRNKIELPQLTSSQ